jgi:hypothetical protein
LAWTEKKRRVRSGCAALSVVTTTIEDFRLLGIIPEHFATTSVSPATAKPFLITIAADQQLFHERSTDASMHAADLKLFRDRPLAFVGLGGTGGPVDLEPAIPRGVDEEPTLQAVNSWERNSGLANADSRPELATIWMTPPDRGLFELSAGIAKDEGPSSAL